MSRFVEGFQNGERFFSIAFQLRSPILMVISCRVLATRNPYMFGIIYIYSMVVGIHVFQLHKLCVGLAICLYFFFENYATYYNTVTLQ